MAYLPKLEDLEAESGLAAAAVSAGGGFLVLGGGLGLAGNSLELFGGSLRGSLPTWSFRAVICDTG